MTKLDPRNIAALRVQLDALADQAKHTEDPHLNEALDEARNALARSADILHRRGLFLQVPHDYKPPPGIFSDKPKQG
jgi:hypothetical protein